MSIFSNATRVYVIESRAPDGDQTTYLLTEQAWSPQEFSALVQRVLKEARDEHENTWRKRQQAMIRLQLEGVVSDKEFHIIERDEDESVLTYLQRMALEPVLCNFEELYPLVIEKLIAEHGFTRLDAHGEFSMRYDEPVGEPTTVMTAADVRSIVPKDLLIPELHE